MPESTNIYVVVDSNILGNGSGLNPRGFDQLSQMVDQYALRVIVPEPVVLELTRQLGEAHRKSEEAARQHAARLEVLGLQPPSLTAQDFDWERIVRSKIKTIAEIAAMPGVDHDLLVRRDLARQRPFKTNGSGYRDALIWETVTELAERGRQIFFLSANEADFGSGSPGPALARGIPEGASVTVVKDLDSLEALVNGRPTPSLQPRSVAAPLSDQAVFAALEARATLITASDVRIGRQLFLDGDIDYIAEWTEMWDASLYEDVDENTGLFHASVIGDAWLTFEVPRHMIGRLDQDVSVELPAGDDDAVVSCGREVRADIAVQYRLDTAEVADVEVLRVVGHRPQS